MCGEKLECGCRVTHQIGHGSYGAVFAVKIKGRRRQCIKVMDMAEWSCIKEVMRTMRKGCIPVENVVCGKRMLGIIMPRAACTLSELCYSANPPSVAQVLAITRRILQNVHKMHMNNVMHRDLKPCNVLIMKGGTISLCDVSMARNIWGRGYLRRSYSPRVCTVHYRAPELMNKRIPDAASTPVVGVPSPQSVHSDDEATVVKYNEIVDVWSVGCIMAFMLLRDHVFDFTDEDDDVFMMANIMATMGVRRWPGSNTAVTEAAVFMLGNPSSYISRTTLSERLTKRYVSGQVSGFETLTVSELRSIVNFLSVCMHLDPSRRPSCSELLSHPLMTMIEARADSLTRSLKEPRVWREKYVKKHQTNVLNASKLQQMLRCMQPIPTTPPERLTPRTSSQLSAVRRKFVQQAMTRCAGDFVLHGDTAKLSIPSACAIASAIQTFDMLCAARVKLTRSVQRSLIAFAASRFLRQSTRGETPALAIEELLLNVGVHSMQPTPVEHAVMKGDNIRAARILGKMLERTPAARPV